MNPTIRHFQKLTVAAAAILLLAACAPALVKPDGATAVRDKLTQLQADSQLATRAPVAIKDAELAVRAAEVPREDKDLARHLVFMADRKVDIARARAQARLSEDQRKTLSDDRASARLDSRTREANTARSDANAARDRAETASIEAAAARSDADAARTDADIARLDTDSAMRQAEVMQQQITALNARETDRGMVVTLGDVLFATGRSDLKGGVPGNLGQLAVFLNKYPDRTVIIEGHTDSVGSDDANRGLSQRRADSVKSYLIGENVDPGRLAAAGLGEGSPVADNNTETGRQQNRRVEVIISNTVTSLK